jgi:hypothetical protein
MGWLSSLLGLDAGKATEDAGEQNKRIITDYDKKGTGIIDAGAAKAGGYLDQVAGLYKPIAGSTAMYGDAIGLNGAEGNTRATGAFETNPGYQFELDQGIQALDRGNAARGSFQSGGAEADVLDYSQGTARKAYGGWLDRLKGTSDTALAGQTGALNNSANLATGTASQKLGLAGDVASGYMSSFNQMAQGQEANKAGIASLGGNLMGLAGKAMGWGGF